MAYTASMLAFMLQNLEKPVVLTGSQLPISSPLSDAPTNLATAFAAVQEGVAGVSVAFDHKILNGCRAVKVRTMGFDAFESVNSPNHGEVLANGLQLYRDRRPPYTQPCTLKSEICNDVFLLKLIPGTNPAIFDMLLKMNYRGVVLEAFGAGGLHFIRRDLSEKLRKLVACGVAVVVCSQCLYERSDLTKYEVGPRALEEGVIPGEDMTSECAATKLMWALGQGMDTAQIAAFFQTSVAGEVTIR